MTQDLGTTMMPTPGCTLTATRSNGWRSTLTQGSSAFLSQKMLSAVLQRAPLVSQRPFCPGNPLDGDH